MSASLPSWARKGVKVVCVDSGSRDPGGRYGTRLVWPDEGCIYTIAGTDFDPVSKRPTVFLTEIPPEGNDRGFYVDRFRPLVSTKTEDEDLAHFTHHLRQPVRESERA